MGALQCRYALYDGELRLEGTDLCFYRDFLGEKKLEKS